jgi:hypothetical protein
MAATTAAADSLGSASFERDGALELADVALVEIGSSRRAQHASLADLSAIAAADDQEAPAGDQRRADAALDVVDALAVSEQRSGVVNGFQFRCRTCQLARSAPDIGEMIRQLANEGHGERSIAARVTPIVLARGLKAPTPRSLGRHCALHVEVTGVVEPERAADGTRPRSVVSHSSGSDDRDHEETWNLYARIIEKIDLLDRDPTALSGRDGTVDLRKLTQWSTLVSAARDTLSALGRMRQRDRFVVFYHQQAVAELYRRFLADLADEFRDLHDVASSLPGGAQITNWMEQFFEERLGREFFQAHIDSMSETAEELGLALDPREVRTKLTLDP